MHSVLQCVKDTCPLRLALQLQVYYTSIISLKNYGGILGWQINGNKRLHTPSLYLCFPCLTAVLQRYRDGICSLLFFHPYISSFVFLAAIVAGSPQKKVLSIQNTCNRLRMRKLCRKSGRGTIDGNVHCKINDHLAIMHTYL